MSKYWWLVIGFVFGYFAESTGAFVLWQFIGWPGR